MSLASDELADRIRALLAPHLPITEQKMFGGRCFMLAGNMLVGPMKDGGMLVRTGNDNYADALTRPGTAPMVMGGRTMGSFIQVSGDVLEDDEVLLDWIEYARSFVETLPPK